MATNPQVRLSEGERELIDVVRFCGYDAAELARLLLREEVAGGGE